MIQGNENIGWGRRLKKDKAVDLTEWGTSLSRDEITQWVEKEK